MLVTEVRPPDLFVRCIDFLFWALAGMDKFEKELSDNMLKKWKRSGLGSGFAFWSVHLVKASRLD